MQVTFGNLLSTALQTIEVNGTTLTATFTGGPNRTYDYAITGVSPLEVVEELQDASSIGRTFNTLVREGMLVPMA